MNYKFAVEDKNYEDFSSGRVLYNQHGATSFPIRLATEIFQRCTEALINNGAHKPFTLFDPCCGGAYMLTTLGFLHGDVISKIYASDINEKILQLAEKNLSLLTKEGIEERISQLKNMFDEYGKLSHYEAQQSALKLQKELNSRVNTIEFNIFNADITKDITIQNRLEKVDILITDLPYGQLVNWSEEGEDEEAVKVLLNIVYPILSNISVVAIVTNKKSKFSSHNYRRVQKFILGKRQVTILQPIK
jgi:23S rRNA (guanine2535-N1)-methyltransferase